MHVRCDALVEGGGTITFKGDGFCNDQVMLKLCNLEIVL